MQNQINDTGSTIIKDKNIPKYHKSKKLIVEVANPKTDEEYAKMIDRVNENFRLLYSTKK